ncbi:MAG: hypothetical protein PUD50_14605, partial [Eubacteriales bacterium]|nr:hypothetical protein [Eubacteriales bacterium]
MVPAPFRPDKAVADQQGGACGEHSSLSAKAAYLRSPQGPSANGFACLAGTALLGRNLSDRTSVSLATQGASAINGNVLADDEAGLR